MQNQSLSHQAPSAAVVGRRRRCGLLASAFRYAPLLLGAILLTVGGAAVAINVVLYLVEDAFRHLELLPRPDGGRYGERPEDEQTDHPRGRLVHPLPGADLNRQV